MLPEETIGNTRVSPNCMKTSFQYNNDCNFAIIIQHISKYWRKEMVHPLVDILHSIHVFEGNISKSCKKIIVTCHILLIIIVNIYTMWTDRFRC